MITNERQLQITRSQVERFRHSLEALEGGSLDTTDLHPLIKQAQIEAVRGQLATLEREVDDYEALRSGAVSSFELDALAELPEGLIRARIAAGLTQRELAGRLGLKEQQVQRYEATRYEGASFTRLVEVANAIGVKVRKRLEVLQTTSTATLLNRLDAAGVSHAFIARRLMPDLDDSRASADRLVGRIGEVFGWSPEAVTSASPLLVPHHGAAAARFKMPKNREARTAAAYTAYAHHLAGICAAAMKDQPRTHVPTDWRAARRLMLERYGAVDFRSALAFAWDHGVVVLPLNDPGAFHGACWRFAGVNVVVLKQAARYPARWLFDLLHELRHAGERPDDPDFEVVEGSETSEERRNAPEEKAASWFAGQVTLDGEAEELVKECLRLADDGDLRKLKRAAQTVATRRGVNLGQLANYLAFRLSMQGENWWGAAANLQDLDLDPLAVAREVFFDRFAFGPLEETDLELLTLALNDESDNGPAT